MAALLALKVLLDMIVVVHERRLAQLRERIDRTESMIDMHDRHLAALVLTRQRRHLPPASMADRLLVPVQPRTFDIWALDQMAELVAEAKALNERLEAFSVLNAADSQGKDNDEAADALRQVQGIGYLPHPVVRRKAFPNAAAGGRSVLEQNPRDAKANDELEALAHAIFV